MILCVTNILFVAFVVYHQVIIISFRVVSIGLEQVTGWQNSLYSVDELAAHLNHLCPLDVLVSVIDLSGLISKTGDLEQFHGEMPIVGGLLMANALMINSYGHVISWHLLSRSLADVIYPTVTLLRNLSGLLSLQGRFGHL